MISGLSRSLAKVPSVRYVAITHTKLVNSSQGLYVLQVRLVQKTDTGKIYAMKTLKKEEMLKKDQASALL